MAGIAAARVMVLRGADVWRGNGVRRRGIGARVTVMTRCTTGISRYKGCMADGMVIPVSTDRGMTLVTLGRIRR